jgi:hypothetical protein
MTWRKLLACKIEVCLDGKKTYSWEKKLPLPHEIPFDQLFVHNQSVELRDLSLQHRRVLWSYQQMRETIWHEAANDFAFWLSRLPEHKQIQFDAHYAGAAVILALIQQNPPKRQQIQVRVHHAPLEWLQRHFQYRPKKNVQLKLMEHPSCPWATLPGRRAA